MNLKRFFTTSLIVMSCTGFVSNITYAGLFSKPANKTKVVHTASNSHRKLPAPTIKLTKNQPITMVSHNKALPKPAPYMQTHIPAPNYTKEAVYEKSKGNDQIYVMKSKTPKVKRKPSVPKYKTSHLTRVAPFKGISANGNILVVVEPGRFQEVKVMNEMHPGYKLVDPTVIKGVLVLRDVSRKNLKKDAPRIVRVKVTTPRLTSISLRDNARIRAINLRTNQLDIDAATTGFVNLRGNIGLHYVLQRGTGPINVEWANSDHVKIISRSRGPVHVAGNADHLTIRANDSADIDAKHLRSHTGLIQTSDKATAAVTVIDALSGFASEMSNIFYYKTPKHLTRHTYDLGNVMQLRYWN